MSDDRYKWPNGIDDQAALLDIDAKTAQSIVDYGLYSTSDDFDDIVFGVIENFYLPAVIYNRPNSRYKGFCLVVDLSEFTDVRSVVNRFIDQFNLDSSVVSWIGERHNNIPTE